LAVKPLNSRSAMQTVRPIAAADGGVKYSRPASQRRGIGNEQVSVYPCTISDCSCWACAMTRMCSITQTDATIHKARLWLVLLKDKQTSRQTNSGENNTLRTQWRRYNETKITAALLLRLIVTAVTSVVACSDSSCEVHCAD